MEDLIQPLVHDPFNTNPAKLLLRICQNIINDPSEQKYRRLSKSKLMPKFTSTPTATTLLSLAGFEDEEAALVLKPDASLEMLKEIERVLEPKVQSKPIQANKQRVSAAISKPQVSTDAKSEAQLRLEAIQAKNKAMVEATKLKKKKHKEMMARKHREARDNVKDRPIQASKGKDLKFGLTLAVHKPAPPPKKGG